MDLQEKIKTQMQEYLMEKEVKNLETQLKDLNNLLEAHNRFNKYVISPYLYDAIVNNFAKGYNKISIYNSEKIRIDDMEQCGILGRKLLKVYKNQIRFECVCSHYTFQRLVIYKK